MPEFIATAPLGAADLLAVELAGLGVADRRERPWGVTFAGPLASAYRACLWSRVASRVLLRLHDAPAATPDALYAAALAIDWSAHLSPGATFAVDFDATRSAITHTHYGAQGQGRDRRSAA
jgi:23S rRNA (guanine2445-N2)-methyltransferase / 23S rRNA (guanine2069-N7)-methyltransferase